MINVILAVDKTYGLGRGGKLAWNVKEELEIFKSKTQGASLICGRVTVDSLPYLKNRTIFCVTRQSTYAPTYPNVYVFSSIEDALESALQRGRPIYVIGGKQVYEYVFSKYKKEIKVHISFMESKYDCDSYLDKTCLRDYVIIEKTCRDGFTHCVMNYVENGEAQYLRLIEDVLEHGEEKIGRNGGVITDFCNHLKFDLRNGFPLLTTRRMFLRGIIEELLFFIRGETNSRLLEEKGINIWKGNTSREFLDANGFADRAEGEMGPMYGKQWRNFNDKGIDQLDYVINMINNEPSSRRILMTCYNPEQAQEGVLFPCHSIVIQFYVHEKYLDVFCFNRSSDIGLGLPFNIASTALLQMLICKICKLEARFLNITLGDAHIYSNHREQLERQIMRHPLALPTLCIPDVSNIQDVEKLTFDQFIIQNYSYHPPIKMEMSS